MRELGTIKISKEFREGHMGNYSIVGFWGEIGFGKFSRV